MGRHHAKSGADFFIRTELERVRKESKMTVEFGELAASISAVDSDLASIAAGLFECEGLVREEIIDLDDELQILLCQSKLINKAIEQALANLISFTLVRAPTVKLVSAKNECADGSGRTATAARSVCLFSGGIDSLAGILKLPGSLKPTAGAFVSHDRMASRVTYLEDSVLRARAIPIQKVTIQRGRTGFQQMRGFLYLTIGAILAKLSGTDNVVVSETGQTMFLPPLAALDQITVTTHPTLVEITKEILHESYGIKFHVYEPFSDLTKAEVVSLCDAKEAIPGTNSCITTRFANQPYSHCGRCYGCLVRRLGCVVAGVKDAQYAKDVLVKGVGDRVLGGWPGQAIKANDLLDLQALLRFSRDVLEGQLDDAARFKIASFGKEDLYRRAALDVLAAMYLLYGKTKQGRNAVVRNFFEECKKDGLISPDIAEGRISDVREQKYQADFGLLL